MVSRGNLAWRLATLSISVLSLCVLAACGGGGGGGGGGVTGQQVTGNVNVPNAVSPIPAPGQPALAITPPANVSGAIVEFLDEDGVLVETATTDSDGNYSVRLDDGTYQVGIQIGSSTFFSPLRSVIIVRGDSVDGTVDVGGEPTLNFELPKASQSIAGTVVDPTTAAVADVRVQFVDSETNLVRFQTTTNSSGAFSLTTLPDGNFVVRLDSSSVPDGFAAPSPIQLSVTSSGASPATLSFTLAAATATSGSVASTGGAAPLVNLSPDGAVQPAFVAEAPLDVPAGALIVIEEVGYGEVARVPVGTDGSYDLNLRDGSYLVTFEGLGSDVVSPAPMRITVKDGLIYTEGSDTALDPGAGGTLDATAHGVTETLTGTITLAGDPVTTKVVAIDPETGGELISVKTDAAGQYSLPLADGSYDIIVRTKLLPPGVVPPTAVRVAVESVADPTTPIKEEQGTVNDGVVNFALAQASATLTGTVGDSSSNPMKDVRIVARKGEKVVARAVTASDGSYSLSLPVGTIKIGIRPESLPTGFLRPDVSKLEVAVEGGVATITGDDGTVTQLNFALEQRAANVTGTVAFDFDGSSTVDADEGVGCTILVTKAESKKVLFSVPTNPITGAYSLVLPNGAYKITVDPQSIPPGTTAPTARRASVTASAVTLGDGTSGASVAVDFTLAPRIATLTGVVSLDGVGVGVGLRLVDASTGSLVRRVRSDQLDGTYRMPLAVGAYRLRINPETLPAGAAIPNPIELGVAADGTVSLDSGALTNPPTLNIALTRTVATLTGAVTVVRSSETFPVEAPIQIRDPQDQTVLFELLSDPEDGSYSVKLLPGSWTIALDTEEAPPGVIPPAPVTVTVVGTTVTGNGVSSNNLDLVVLDTRTAGVDIEGFVVDLDADVGVPAEIRVYDPSSGDAETNFLLSVLTAEDGSFDFKAVEGTYEVAVLPASLPTTAIPPATVVLTVQGSTVIENNTKTSAFGFTATATDFTSNAANDGKIGFTFRDGASSGITITGVVDDGSNPVPFARVVVKDASTQEEVLDMFTDFETGSYTTVLPLGSYELAIDPYSLPFGTMAPDAKDVQAVDNGGTIVVTTNGGAAVSANGDGNYEFDFTVETASQTLTGVVTDPSSNPVRVFVTIVDAVSNEFITGRWSSESTGAFSALLAPGAYKVKLDPPSLPFGTGTPGPVNITVTASNILETSGTANDGAVQFQLVSSNRVISGTVQDSGSNPIGCFVIATDIVSGLFVAGAPTAPSTGAYSMTLPPGSYSVAIDPYSLPPGYVPSAPQTVQVTEGNGSANFSVSIASLCVTGRVVTATNELPLSVFVQLKDAATNVFVAGAPTDFATGGFSICAPPGNYKISIDALSLPSGSVQPASQTVNIGSASILESNETTIGVEANAANDGLMNFRISDTDVSTLANLTGTVTLDPGAVPLGAFIIVEDATTGAFVTGTPSDPGAGGAYSIPLPDGSYKVLIDAFSVPPGLILPTPRQLSVSGTTITQQSAGVSVTSSTLNFVLEEASNQITGSVTLSSAGFSAVIQVIDPDDDFILFETPTAPDGSYSLTLPNGSYLIGVAPYSLPPALPVPVPVLVSVSNGFVNEAAGTANDGVIPFDIASSSTQLTGRVVNDVGARLFANVFIVDPNSGAIIMESFTTPDQEFSFQVIDATFDVVVDPFSLPLDVVPPLPSTITSASGAFTLDTAGSGSFVDADTLEITATQAAAITALPIKLDDTGTPVSGFVEILDSNDNLLFGLFVPATANGADVFLGDGTYTVHVDPFSLPGGFAPPADKTLVVSSAGTSFTVDGVGDTEVVFDLIQGTLQGKIVRAFLGGSQRVELDLLDGNGAVLIDNITLTQDTNDATYGSGGDILVGDGTYTLRLERADGEDASSVILAASKTVNVLNGVIQNPDDDPSTGTIDVNLTLPIIQGTVSGTVDLAATPLEAVTINLKNPVNQKIVNSTATASDGTYTLAVPAGVFELVPNPASLAAVAPTAIPTDPIDLSVSASGSVTIVGTGVCTGDPDCTGVDFALSAFNPSTDAEVTGTVTAVPFGGNSEVVQGASVFLVNSSGAAFASTTTASDGTYSLIAPDGVWYVYVDTFGLDVGFPILPPNPSQVTVNGTTVNPSSTVNFAINGASALINGRVQKSNGVGVGARLVVTPASATSIPDGFVYDIFTDPEGHYLLPVGQGSKKLWVDPSSLPPGFTAPLPINFTVNGTNVNESNVAGTNNAANDGKINPVVSSGGATIRVVTYEAGTTNPVPCFVELLKAASNPSDPPIFIAGAETDPATGIVNFTASGGSYFVKIDPFSLPGDLQSNDSIDLAISGSTVTWEAGASLTSIDPGTGSVDHGTLFVATAGGTLSGLVRTDLSDPSTAVPGVIIVLDAGNGTFVKDAFASPADGSYSLSLGDGVYDVFVDPQSIPSTLIAGSPVRVTVDGASVLEEFDTPDDGTVSFELSTSNNSLTGIVVDGSDTPIEAAVGLFAPNASGEFEIFVTGTLSDYTTGLFTIPVSNGTYQVRVDPGSVPPGLSTPVPVSISVTDSGISFPASATVIDADGDTNEDDLQLTLSEASAGVSGTVADSAAAPVSAFVIAEDATTGAYYGGAPTEEDGTYSIPLPAGTFKIFVDPYSLPIGSVPPAQQQVSVSSSVVTGVDFLVDTAGDTFTGFVLNVTDPSQAIDCSAISGDGNVDPISCVVILVEPSPDASQPPTFLFETVTRASDGFFQMPIGDGTYEVHVDGASLPGGMLPPAPITVVNSGGTLSVTGETLDCSNDASQKILQVQASAQTLTGVIQDESAVTIGGVFVELVNASTGAFVTGQPTSSTGTFSLGLGAQSYELRVDPYSLPPGLAAPAPVAVTVTGGAISVGTTSGVDWDGSTMTITLASASASVSGTVVDTDQNPMSARVVVRDFNDQFIADAWSSGSDGSYSIGLAAGNYNVKIDSFSLPAGSMAPPSQVINLVDNPSATADFVIQSAPATITGNVFYDDSGTPVGVPGYVFITDANTGDFIVGAYASPNGGSDYVYSLAVGQGNFQVQVDPFSVPTGIVVPPPVGFSVTVNSISGDVTIAEDDQGDGSDTTDGTIHFECDSASATLVGALQNAGGDPVPGLVFAQINDGSGTIVAEAFTDSSGEFSLPFTPGNYQLFVDPGSLPPAHVAPPPSTVTVVDSTITINGSAPGGPPHVIVIGVADATVNGHVFKNTTEAVVGAYVFATESDSGAFVAGFSTNAAGEYTLGLVDGTYLLQVDPYSLPTGFIPPAPTQIHVASSSIYLGPDSSGTDVTSADVDLLVDAPAATVTVQSLNDVGQPVDVQVNVRDAVSEALVVTEFTSAGTVAIGLPAGQYLVRIPSFSVPPGSMTPAPISLTVNGDGTTSDSSGNPSDGFLQFIFQQAAATAYGNVTLASDASAVAGALIVAVDPETDLSYGEALTGPAGDYFIDLPVGTFDLIVAEGFPATAVRPAPFRVTVSPGSIEPAAPYDFALEDSVGSLSGTVSLDGTGRLANILVFRDESGTYVPVTAAQTEDDGTYSFAVPAGDLVAVAGILEQELPDPTVDMIAPLPVSNTFSAPGPTDTNLDFTFFTPGDVSAPVSEILRGSVSAAGAPAEIPVQITYNGMPMAAYDAPGGDYRMAIMADSSRMFDVQLFDEGLPSSFTLPAAVTITVDDSASPAISGTGVTEDSGEFVLDFLIDVDGVALTGTITDWDSNPLAGIEVRSFDLMTGSQGPTVLTDSSGQYAAIFPEGEYALELGGGLPSTAIRPAPVEVEVVDESGTLAMTVDGVSTQVADFQLSEGVARLSGQILLGGAPGDGEVVAYVAGQEVGFNFASGGSYEILLPVGDVTVIAEPLGLSGDLVLAAPYSATIADTGSLEQISHDFVFGNAGDGTTPNGFVNGFVLSDGSGIEAELEIFDANGDVFGFAFANDFDGSFFFALPPGDYTVTVHEDDVPTGALGATSADITVTDGAVDGAAVIDGMLTFQLNTTGTDVAGTVSDPSGSPVEGAVILFESYSKSKSPGFGGSSVFAVTDSSGAYALKLEEDTEYEVFLEPSTLPTGVVVPADVELTVESDPITLDFDLVASVGLVAGTVTIDGVAAEDVEIWALGSSLEDVTYTATAADGTYVLPLAAGDYTITAELDDESGIPLIAPASVEVTIVTDSSITGTDFAFTTPDPATSQDLMIEVTQAGMSLPADGYLLREESGSFVFHQFWDGDFSQAIVPLLFGTYQVVVESVNDADLTLTPVTVLVDATGVSSDGEPLPNNTVTFEIPGAPAGIVLASDGYPLSSTEIELVPVGSGFGTSNFTDSDGEYEFGNLEDGHYWLTMTSVFGNDAAPRAQLVTVEDGEPYPPTINLISPVRAGVLSGTVTVESVGTSAIVYVFDRGLDVVAVTRTDGSGGYSLPLVAGNYTVIAVPEFPAGNEVPSVPTETVFTTDTTVDIDLSTSAPSTALSGVVSFGGELEGGVVLVTDASTGVPVTLATPDEFSGDYAVNLPDGSYEVSLLGASIPVAVVSFEPVAITVGSSTVSGTDPDGAAISANTLDLDPFGNSDFGEIRTRLSDLYEGFMDRDETQFSSALEAVVLWSGQDLAALTTAFTTGADDSTPDQYDHLVAFISGSGDSYTATLVGRESFLNSDDELRAFVLPSETANPEFTLTVARADSVSPFLVQGNGLHVEEMGIESVSSNSFDGTTDTPSNSVEWIVVEHADFPLVSAATAGTGVSDGTLTEDDSFTPVEWYAFVDDSTSGPSPFAATLGSLVDGDTFTTTATYASGADSIDVIYHAPTASLYPTTTVALTEDGGVLAVWTDIAPQLERGYGLGFVELAEDSGSGYDDVFEDEDLPAGQNALLLDSSLFTVGNDYAITVGVMDVGGAIHEYELLFSYPPGDVAVISGTVTDDSAAAVAGMTVEANDPYGSLGTPLASATTDSNGDYQLILPIGSYVIEVVDSSGVYTAPPGVDVDVEDLSGTLTITIDGVEDPTGVIDFELGTAAAQLTGTITSDGSLYSGSAEVLAFVGGELVAESYVSYEDNGAYSISLPAGDVTVIAISEGSVGIPPAPFTQTITDTGSVTPLTHDFDFVTTGGTPVSGNVTSDGISWESDLFVFESGSLLTVVDSYGFWNLTLEDGTYTLEIPTGDLPVGYSGTNQATFQVTAGVVTGPGVDEFGTHHFVLNTMGNSLSGTVTDGSGTGLPDLVVRAISSSAVVFSTTGPNGDYGMLIGNGEFVSVEVFEGSLSGTQLAPAPVDVTMDSDQTVNFTIFSIDGSVAGTVSVDGVGTPGAVKVWLDDEVVAEADTESDGTYVIDLPSGDFTVTAEVSGYDPTTQIMPDPAAITISGGTNLTGVDFDFVATSSGTSQTLNATVTDAGTPAVATVEFFKEVGLEFVYFTTISTMDSSGDQVFSIALSPGNYELEVTEVDGQPAEYLVELVVSSSDIQVDSTPLPSNQLDIDLPALAGSITNSAGPLASVTVTLSPKDGTTPLTTTTDTEGGYAFASLTEGEYWLTIDSSALTTGEGMPWIREVIVTSEGVVPRQLNVGVPSANFTLSGTVTIDSVGAPATIFVMDRGLRMVAIIPTDGAGAYSVDLPDGEYSAFATLASPGGTEVPPVLPAIDLTASNVTHDIAFDTSAASQTLSGTVSIAGVATPLPVLVYKDGAVPAPVAWIQPAVDGTYSALLPEDTLEAILEPDSLPVGTVSFDPITLVIDGTGIAGTDPDGAAISGGVLNLDPYGASDAGEVRETMGDFFLAVMTQDAVAMDSLMDSALLWNGRSKTDIATEFASGENFFFEGLFLDRIQASVSGSGDAYTLTIEEGRQVGITDDNQLSIGHWDQDANGSPMFTFDVQRADSVSPWQFAGNGLSISRVEVFAEFVNIDDGVSPTTENAVEFAIEAYSGVPLTAASVSGTGISDGTLSLDPFSDDEYLGFVDDSPSSGPTPFAATLASLVDGEAYAFTATFSAGSDTPSHHYRAPVAGLHPAVNVSVAGDDVLVTWTDISALLARPVSEINVFVVLDTGSGEQDIFELDGLVPGTNWVRIPSDLLQSGADYEFEVEYVDVGGAAQISTFETSWPMP